jgi:predicted regulator of Ras-like GTPase activity (Roadblock/LC7/MglB family)
MQPGEATKEIGMDFSQATEAEIDLPTGITIFPAQAAEIDHVLDDLIQRIPARFVLLTEVSGLMVSFRGERAKLDLVALGSLAASDLAASQTIAQLTGEYENYQLVLRQGERNNTLLSEVGRHLVLLVQAPSQVPLGWARMIVIEAARQLEVILNTPQKPADEATSAPQLEQAGLNDLFGQAFENLWAS